MRGGLEEFTRLLDHVKERKMDRLEVPNHQENMVSPNRHWKRGLGREGTPGRGERDSVSPGPRDSVPRSRDSHRRDDLEHSKSLLNAEIAEISRFLSDTCDNLSEREMVDTVLG